MAFSFPKGRNSNPANDAELSPEEEEKPSHKRPEPEELTVELIRERASAASKAILGDRKEYYMNDLFLRGKQWIKYNNTDQSFVPWRRRGGRYQATINKLDNLVTTYMGKINRADLVFNVPASTADDYAIQGALVSEAIITYKHDDCGWEDKREELTLATIKGGTAALVTEWDAGAKSYGAVRTGDTTEQVLNITEFALEPGAKSVEKARWWVKQQVVPTATAQAIYKLEDEPRADHNSGGPYGVGLGGDLTGTQAKGCLVTTYYERPNFLRPAGAVAVVVNDQLVWGPKAWPFPFKDRLNIEVVCETVVDGQWNGLSRLSKARSVQVAYNFVASNIDDHIKKVGTAKFIAPYGSSEVFDQMDDDPANPIRYPDGAQPPGYLPPPNMPSYILQRLDKLEADMQDIMGVHDVSQGVAPTNIESGFGLQTLAENDNSASSALAKRIARAFSQTAQLVLRLYADRVSDTREATVYDEGRVAQTVKWNGKTISGQTKVIIPKDAIIPHSRAAMQQFAETLAKMGMLPPGQEGLTLMMELAEVPNREQSLWYINPAEARARYDVARIMQGETVIPQDFHNHDVSIKVANRARMSPRYDTLTTKVRRKLDLFVDAHETMAAEEAGQQIRRAAMSPALANAPTANQAAPLPAELTGINPTQPAMLPQGLPSEAQQSPQIGDM